MVLVISVVCLGKIFGIFVVVKVCRVDVCKVLIFGILMNIKGLVEFIVLNIGLDCGVSFLLLFNFDVFYIL